MSSKRQCDCNLPVNGKGEEYPGVLMAGRPGSILATASVGVGFDSKVKERGGLIKSKP